MGFVDDLKQALGLDERGEEDSWENRIKTAAYTTPSGTRITFDFEDVSMYWENKTSAFEFPDGDGTYVQSSGPTSRRFPLRIFFWGADHDKQAKIMELALRESGDGILEHPLYGTFDVVPFGRIVRRDDLVRAANQTVFEVEFWNTVGLIYPSSQADPENAVLDALAEFNIGSADQFATQLDTNSAAEEGGFLNTINDLLDKTEDGLSKVAAVQDVVNNQFQDVVDSINRGIDVLIGQPLALAFQTKVMIQAPARALAAIKDRLAAYGNLASDIFSSSDAVSAPGGVGAAGPGPNAGGIGSAQSGGTAGASNDSQSPNKFHTRDLFASTYVSGSVLSAVENVFATKTEAIEAAVEIQTQFEALVTWRDENYESISGQKLPEAEAAEFIPSPATVDLGDTIQTLQKTVALCLGYLVEASFELKQENSVVLDRARTALDFVFEIYGRDNLDANLDFFIETNNLTGSEILELPRGKTVVYFV